MDTEGLLIKDTEARCTLTGLDGQSGPRTKGQIAEAEAIITNK